MVQPIARKLIINPFSRFFQRETSGGIVLIFSAFTALIWANSPWQDSYFHLWQMPFLLGFEGVSLSLSLHAWINDGLMAIFFFLVGLEIKRELLVGELSSVRQAILPFMAAMGGMLLPGCLYILLNPPGSPFNAGWGIPTVTDIAFSLGILALLGNRVPLFLKVFLAALAIVDDLGSVLIIAFFYSSGIQWIYLGWAALFFLTLLFLNRLGTRWLLIYLLLGGGLWLSVFYSGIHASIAGVLLALTIPARSKIKVTTFYEEGLAALHSLHPLTDRPEDCSILTEDDYQAGVQNIESLCKDAQAPLQRLEHTLHPLVTYGIMPLFAFANAGVSLSTISLIPSLTHPLTMGIILGLVLGKQIGITLFTWLSVKLKLAELPQEIRWIHIYGLACLGGIGFTMSLFIAGLAFNHRELDMAKVGIMAASLVSGSYGYRVLHRALKPFKSASASL